jgi:hypothetical protein
LENTKWWMMRYSRGFSSSLWIAIMAVAVTVGLMWSKAEEKEWIPSSSRATWSRT